MGNMKLCLCNTKRGVRGTLFVGLSIANCLYLAVLLQFLFTVVACLFA